MASLPDVVARLFSSEGFVPRRFCGSWPDWLVREHLIGDGLVWLAYVAMPVLLWRLARRRSEYPRITRLMRAFAGFVVLCGLGHFLDMLAFYRPMYRFSGHVLIATGLASCWTAWSLYRAWPVLNAMRSPEELEREVDERTADLARANGGLREAEGRWRQLADAMPQIVWTARPDGCLDYYNQRWYEFTGLLRGGGDESWKPVLHPDDLGNCLDVWDRAVQTGEPYQIEYRFKHQKTGDYRWHLGRALAVRDDSGQVVRWIGTCTDIDDQKRAEQSLRAARKDLEERVRERTCELSAAIELLRSEDAERERVVESLRQSHARFQGIFDASVVGMALVAPDGHWLDVNRSLCEILGYSEEELLATDFQNLTHPDDLDADLALSRQTLDGAISSYQMEKRYLHKHGHAVWAALSVSLVRDKGGLPLYFVALMEDVTPRKKAEETLKEREQRLRAVFDHTFQFMGLLAPDGTVLEANRSSLEFAGVGRDAVVGRPFWEGPWWSGSPEAREQLKAAVAEAAEGRVVRFEAEHPGADGRAVTVDFSLKPVTDETGRVVMLLPEGHDVSDRKRAEVALARAKDSAEAATRAKSEFLANMSHEVRTPMNGIMGMTDLTLETDLTPRQRDYLVMVKSSADALLTVINDILDFSKIEAGKLELSPSPFLLRDVLEETVRTLAPRAHAKGLELACRTAPDVPDELFGDSGRLRQVVVNLLGNAIKFTAHGEIVLQAEARAGGGVAGEVEIHFSVTDTGVGIAAEKIASIFDPFEQADNSTTRCYGGTGLGLAISGKLVALMGGRIWVESRVGRGSTFHFTARLHRQPENQEAGGRRVKAPLDGARVLVVDDNATNRRILVEVLTSWGALPSAVADGPAALDELRGALRLGRPFAAAVIDMMMPEMDGVELSERVRSEPDLAAIPLLLMSSDGGAERATTGGPPRFDACLSKPLRQSEMYNALAGAIGTGTAATPSPPDPASRQDPRHDRPTTGEGRPGARVLLAEDHPVNQKLAARVLESSGHRVTIVADGRQALNALHAGDYDVVLMDLQMPVMDGFEALARIRALADDSKREIPVVALTAHAMKGDRERCLAAGFDDYLTKPVRADALREVIEKLAQAVPAPVAWDDLLMVGLVERCAGDLGFARELLAAFLETASLSTEGMTAAVRSGETDRLAFEAHGLKGACLTIGADDLALACRRLEEAGRDQDPVAASDELRKVLGDLAGLSTALEAFLLGTVL